MKFQIQFFLTLIDLFASIYIEVYDLSKLIRLGLG